MNLSEFCTHWIALPKQMWLAVGDRQHPVITSMIRAICGSAKAAVYFLFCGFQWQEPIGASALFFLPCSHFPELWVMLAWRCSQAHGQKSCVWQQLVCRQELINASWIHGDRKRAWRCYPWKPELPTVTASCSQVLEKVLEMKGENLPPLRFFIYM